MIKTKEDLKEYLRLDRETYLGTTKQHIKKMLLSSEHYYLWKLFNALRREEYHLNCRHKYRTYFWCRQRRRLGLKLGIMVCPNSIGKGVRICHAANILVHGSAKVGDFCQLHGMNCIGNKRSGDRSGVPVIGSHVELGVGAVVLGNVQIADDVIIGANAVVTKSCLEKGAVLTGIPARKTGTGQN